MKGAFLGIGCTFTRSNVGQASGEDFRLVAALEILTYFVVVRVVEADRIGSGDDDEVDVFSVLKELIETRD